MMIPEIAEANVQREGMEWVRSMGSRVYRRNTGGMRNDRGQYVAFSERGAADSWGITPKGVHFELEFKKVGNRPTYYQVLWLLGTNGIGGSFSLWVDSMRSLQIAWGHLMRGARVVYVEDVRRYTVREHGRNVKVYAPSGDYDLVY